MFSRIDLGARLFDRPHKQWSISSNYQNEKGTRVPAIDDKPPLVAINDHQPPRVRPPTIRDVALAAGVAVGTRSKALNGRGRLREETRARVLREAERLDFRPNDLIKSLLRGRTFTVGMITTDYFGRFNMPIVHGIEDALGAAE